MSVAAPSNTLQIPLDSVVELSKDMEAAGRIDELVCPVSQETMENPWAIPCGHSFEKAALDLLAAQAQPACPLCRFKFQKHEMVKNFALASATPKIGREFRKLESSIEALQESQRSMQAEREADRQRSLEVEANHAREFAALREMILSKNAGAVSREEFDESEKRHAATEKTHAEAIAFLKQQAEERRQKDKKNVKDSVAYGAKIFVAEEVVGMGLFALMGAGCPPSIPVLLAIGASVGFAAGVPTAIGEGFDKYKKTKNDIDKEYANLEVKNASGT